MAYKIGLAENHFGFSINEMEVVEPVPLVTFGFPANPVNGQQHTYTNPGGSKITFTYNATVKAWMLPEVQALINKEGGTWKQAPPQFNGAILTAIAIPALGEPTIAGEIILAGATVVAGTIFVYDVVTYYAWAKDADDDDLAHCVKLFITL